MEEVADFVLEKKTLGNSEINCKSKSFDIKDFTSGCF